MPLPFTGSVKVTAPSCAYEFHNVTYTCDYETANPPSVYWMATSTNEITASSASLWNPLASRFNTQTWTVSPGYSISREGANFSQLTVEVVRTNLSRLVVCCTVLNATDHEDSDCAFVRVRACVTEGASYTMHADTSGSTQITWYLLNGDSFRPLVQYDVGSSDPVWLSDQYKEDIEVTPHNLTVLHVTDRTAGSYFLVLNNTERSYFQYFGVNICGRSYYLLDGTYTATPPPPISPSLFSGPPPDPAEDFTNKFCTAILIVILTLTSIVLITTVALYCCCRSAEPRPADKYYSAMF